MLVLLMLVPGQVVAQGFLQGEDPLLIVPQVFVIVDTSGSMTSGSYPCGARGDLTCNRQYALREVLTGNYTGSLGDCSTQLENGILDKYNELVRFAFATFDNDNCSSSGGSLSSWDYGDDTASNQLLGIKGRGTFEGALVDFVDPASPTDILGNNARAQNSACSNTASGCTPLAASLYDAYYYFQNWQAELGGYEDPVGHCRESFVLLMSDGAEYPGAGWYNSAPYWASQLFASGVPVFVVGFGDSYLADSLNAIASAGTGGLVPGAFMAENPGQLKEAFDDIIRAILAGASSRTEVASTPSRMSTQDSYTYHSFFEIPLDGSDWKGYLIRTRITLDQDGVPIVTNDQVHFNDLLANMNPNDRNIYTVVNDPRSSTFSYGDNQRPMPRGFSTNPRDGLYPFQNGYTAVDELMELPSYSERTCLNYEEREVCTDQQIACQNDNGCSANYICQNREFCRMCLGYDASNNCISWGDFETTRTCETSNECTAWTEGVDPAVLAGVIKDYVRGVPGTEDVAGNPIDGPRLGDIFHSDPVVVTPPTAMGANYKYESFFRQYFNRDTMLYVGSNDGMLHAFVAEDNNLEDGDRTGEELWAFIPNNLLGKIQERRSGHSYFMDGTAVVKSAYFRNLEATDLEGNVIRDEQGNAIMGAYRTVLVSGQRGGGGAYIAMDVTDPDEPKYLWEYRPYLPLTTDYNDPDSRISKLQSWSKPIIGQVWLKNANDQRAGEPSFLAKSVAIVPGGYFPSRAIMEASSCVEFVEMLVSAASLHILDLETGKLMRKFIFSPDGEMGDNWQKIQDYYADLEAGDTSRWDESFTGGDYRGGLGWAWGDTRPTGAGWFCREYRDNLQIPPGMPDILSDSCAVVRDDEEAFEVNCCDIGTATVDPRDCDPLSPAVTSCYYSYVKYKNPDNPLLGSVVVKLKGLGCTATSNGDRGLFNLLVGDDFIAESVNATPAAYNTSLDEFVSRVFVPTSTGKIWRVDLSNALYDETAAEGEMISAYTTTDANGNSITYDWDVSRDSRDDPIPWYDTGVLRPIMVSPTIALNYRRNLVVFFGTGVIDDLSYTTTTDRFYAVEETRPIDAANFFQVEPQGVLFGDTTNNPMVFAQSERLFGKPLVVGGNVYLTTYTPHPDQCEPGTGITYGLSFDNFNNEIIDEPIVEPGKPMHVDKIWTKAGGVVVKPTPDGDLHVLGSSSMRTSAQVMHWARVL
jgi:hypothetical protein